MRKNGNIMSVKIIVICGPTGSGKSGLALTVARELNGVIINADSMQVYRGMDIGTAKPAPEERRIVPHRLFDIVDPDEDFDAAAYARLATQAIEETVAQGRVPLLVGGTGLYIRALLYGLWEGPAIPETVRSRYRELYERHGAPYMHAMLEQADPAMAARLHINDYVRVLRALEVWEATGKSLLSWQAAHGGFTSPRFDALQIGVERDREELYARTDARVDAMLDQGFAAEVRNLLEQGYCPELKSMQAIGYKHMAAYFSGALDYDEMVCLMKRDTRRYAKRQLTWFKRDADVIWLKASETARFIELARAHLGPAY